MKRSKVCAQQSPSSRVSSLIRGLYCADQRQRRRIEDYEIIAKSDKARADFAKVVLASRSKNGLTGRDAFKLGMLLHHAECYKEALRCAEIAIRGKYGDGLWLAAAVNDRCALKRFGGQLYGTQFLRSESGVTLKPLLPASMRRQHRLLPLAEEIAATTV